MKFHYSTDNPIVFGICFIVWGTIVAILFALAAHISWKAAALTVLACWMANCISYRGKRILG